MAENNTNSNNRGNTENNTDGGGSSGWGTTAAVVGTIGVAVGALGYWLSSRGTEAPQQSGHQNSQNSRENHSRPGPPGHQNSRNSRENRLSPNRHIEPERQNFISSLNDSLVMFQGQGGRRGVPRHAVPANPHITNLNSLLHDIYVRYIALDDQEFEIHYRVFNDVFNQLLRSMKEVDPYFNQYSSRAQFAGSHYDRLRIKKPDEFDMDIVIGLPLNIHHNPNDAAASDIILEPKTSGYLQLKMGVQFQKLPFREGWSVNKTAYEWKDDSNYLLRTKFINWFKSVVNRALNQYLETTRPVFYVDGVPYIVEFSEGGPAMTLYIMNESQGFKMDVDLVPALKFPESRWPICRGYREIPPGCSTPQQMWMVVPKENRNVTGVDQLRSWRLAMHDQERGLMYNRQNMKQTIRLMKKLRDSLKMSKIASYYVKTLFFWVAEEQREDPSFWQKDLAQLFQIMVVKFHDAMVSGNIPYFWNRNNNLIGNVDRAVLNDYARKLSNLIALLQRPADYRQVAKFLLTPEEFANYNRNFFHI